MILTKVDLRGGGDGVIALYIDGKLNKYGDYYHDKISDWILGFKGALEFLNVEFFWEDVEIEEDNKWVEECSELGGIPPQSFEDIYNTEPQ